MAHINDEMNWCIWHGSLYTSPVSRSVTDTPAILVCVWAPVTSPENLVKCTVLQHTTEIARLSTTYLHTPGRSISPANSLNFRRPGLGTHEIHTPSYLLSPATLIWYTCWPCFTSLIHSSLSPSLSLALENIIHNAQIYDFAGEIATGISYTS